MTAHYDFIVAGAGIWGCTIARRLAEGGWKVLILEKRDVVGGNCRCETDPSSGIEVHTFGSHIFHTDSKEVWDFANRFVSFNGYQHKVLARHDGRTYFLPLGLTLINKFFGVELTPAEVPAFMADEAHSRAIFDAFFRNYTSKQWGMPADKVDPSIIRRVPVRSNYEANYYNDYMQGIPSEGYNAFFERLLNHPGIEVRVNSPFSLEGWLERPDSRDMNGSPLPVFYSGPIDELFGYKFGPLPWRTLRFETERQPVADWQGTSVVNYVDADVPFTRIHEYKHYHPEKKDVMAHPETIICREYPRKWEPGDEPYYPVNTPESATLLDKYRGEAAKLPWLTIGGRLGEYKYYDMDKAIAAALRTSCKFAKA
jgi:UDP-galactopyranose mutase